MSDGEMTSPFMQLTKEERYRLVTQGAADEHTHHLRYLLREAERDLKFARSDLAELLDVLRRNGFRECDIPVCNCCSWHAGPNRKAELLESELEAARAECDAIERIRVEQNYAYAERVKELEGVLKAMMRTHGAHGPCENNSCDSCDRTYEAAQFALSGGAKPGEGM